MSRPLHCAAALALVFLLAWPLAARAASGATITYLPDAKAVLTIDEVASPGMAASYMPYVPSFMAFSRLPDAFNGAVWLRMAFGPSHKAAEGPARISFGSALPGTTRLYIPRADGSFTAMTSYPPRGVFVLPDNAPFPEVVYARIDGTPGLWFRPVVGFGASVAGDFPVHLALIGVLALAMLLLLIQYIRKAEEWRLWAAITAGCGIVTALLPPIPPATQAFAPLIAVSMLMPGMILVFFAHTSRHLLATPKTMPGYDRLLVCYYVLGGAVALLPLVPGYLWTARYLPLTALALLPFLALGMVALARSLKGAAAFLCASLLPIAGAALSAGELAAPGAPLLEGSGALWGLALGLIVLGFTGPTKAQEDARSEDDVFASLDRACAFPSAPGLTANGAHAVPESPAIAPAPDHRDETLSRQADESDEEYPELSLFDSAEPETPAEPRTDPPADAELSLPVPPDDAHPAAARDAAADESDSVAASAPAEQAVPAEIPAPAPVAMEESLQPSGPAAPAPLPASRTITLEDEELASSLAEGVAVDALPAPVSPGQEEPARKSLFDLPMLIKETYDTIAALAEQKNLGLTWFIAPQTGRLFEGEAGLLTSALRLLLRDMVEAVDRGNVRLNVRRLPDSVEAGHLVFTVVEWDAKLTSHARNMAGLAEAWALAEKTGGIFSVEHSPTGGTTVIFSAVFTAIDRAKEESAEPAATPDELQETFPASLPSALDEPESASPIQVFVDHPDIALPADCEPAAQPLMPAGFDGDELAEEREAERSPERVIVVDTATSSRARTAAMLTDTPYSVMECASPSASVALYTRHPAALLIMNADMPEADIVAAIHAIREEDEAHGRPWAKLITLVEHALQADRMANSGSNATLMKPVSREMLLDAVLSLIPLEDLPAGTDALPFDEKNERAVADAADHPVAGLPIPPAMALVKTPDASTQPVEETNEVEETGEPQWPEQSEPDADASSAGTGAEATSPLPTPETRLHNALDAALSEDEHDTASGFSEGPAPEAAVSGIFATALPAEPDGGDDQAAPATAKRVSGPELALLDMIVTDEDDEDDVEIHRERPAPQITVTAASVRKAPPVAAKATVVARVRKQEPADAPNHPARQEQPHPGPEAPEPPAPQPDLANPEPEPASKSRQNALADALQPDNGAALQLVPEESLPPRDSSIPLPGAEDSIFNDMLPLIPGLVHELGDAMRDAARGKEEKSPMIVQEAAERIAGKAEAFGLTKLERMARCVERAAAADDIEPMECVLADLESWVARYKEALQKLHREMRW